MTRYEWDAGNLPHIAAHRVTPAECEEAFTDPRRVPADARAVEGEVRAAIIGATVRGRVLRVVFTVRGDAVRVVTAHRASRTQAQDYPGAAPAEPVAGGEEDDDD